jgi:hypothetical protein
MKFDHMPERVIDSTRFTQPSFALHSESGFSPVIQGPWTSNLQPIQPLRELDVNKATNAPEVDLWQNIYMGLSPKTQIRGL